MPEIIKISKVNESTLAITSNEISVEYELNDFFTFDVPGAKFMPMYKAKIWDGKARLYNIHRKTLPFGLYEYVLKFAKDRGYKIETTVEFPGEQISREQIKIFCESLNIHSRGEKIELRDYQVEAVYQAITKGRLLALSPTSSGKSVIIYCYVRWHLMHNRRIILMVPTTSLVTQMFNDFIDYSSANKWEVENYCHKLYSGQPKIFGKPVLITTWQAIHAFSKRKTSEIINFYKSWDVYIGDEAHRFASNSILTISNKLVNAKFRLGTTGTIQDAKVSKLTLEGSFGPVYQVITTKDLMNAGQVVKLNIKCLILNYNEEVRKLFKNADYQKEIDYLVTCEKRNEFIANLAKATKGNTLVLFRYVEKQGKPLYNLIKQKCSKKTVFYISGEISTDEREYIRQVLEKHDNAILVASYATLSTGVNIPSIENIIFASPIKSKITNLQSIGRGLRLKEGKTQCQLFDIADNLSFGSKMNYSMLHLKERLEHYQKENFVFSIKKVIFE